MNKDPRQTFLVEITAAPSDPCAHSLGRALPMALRAAGLDVFTLRIQRRVHPTSYRVASARLHLLEAIDTALATPTNQEGLDDAFTRFMSRVHEWEAALPPGPPGEWHSELGLLWEQLDAAPTEGALRDLRSAVRRGRSLSMQKRAASMLFREAINAAKDCLPPSAEPHRLDAEEREAHALGVLLAGRYGHGASFLGPLVAALHFAAHEEAASTLDEPPGRTPSSPAPKGGGEGRDTLQTEP